MIEPRYYQTAANSAVWNYLSSESGNPLVVLPTGAGKSLVIAMLIEQALKFDGRVIVLQHRKELIEQNAAELQGLVNVPVGIYSSGLKSRQTSHDVLMAGIQSIYRKAGDIGDRHLVIIDEAHLVSQNEETMYGQFLGEVKLNNPRSRVVGLTATPFRTGEGPLCGRTKLFQRIVYEAQTGQLIEQGFLCPITNKPADAEVDTSGIKMRGGEFIESEMQAAFSGNRNVVTQACEEIIDKCRERKSILIFSSGVLHAEDIANDIGCITRERVGLITGETLPIERSTLLSAFKSQDLRWLVNCDVLTTGFNAKCIDAIAVLRATMSPGLFCQIVGRGLRLHPSKTNCLILDFGENIKRHGSIDDPNYGRASEERRGAMARAAENNGRGKPCPACGIDVAANTRQCECGFVFPVKHEGTSDGESTLTGKEPPEVWSVVGVCWGKHVKKSGDGPPTLRIDYECQKEDADEVEVDHECKCKLNCGSTRAIERVKGPHIGRYCKACDEWQGWFPKKQSLLKTKISEWICIEHEGYARTKAGLWWQCRSVSNCPPTIDEALSLLHRGALRMSSQITTVKEGKYFRIKSCEFVDEIPEEWEDEPEAVEEFSGFDGYVPF